MKEIIDKLEEIGQERRNEFLWNIVPLFRATGEDRSATFIYLYLTGVRSYSDKGLMEQLGKEKVR